jgi:hypothetical protein
MCTCLPFSVVFYIALLLNTLQDNDPQFQWLLQRQFLSVPQTVVIALGNFFQAICFSTAKLKKSQHRMIVGALFHHTLQQADDNEPS